jgi:opacity protein-like surface antigen
MKKKQEGDSVMNQLRARVSLYGAILLAALFSTLPAHAQDDARRATAPPGKALVFVFRNDRVPLADQVPVIVNTERVGALANGSFVRATVSPGYTSLRVGDRVLSTLDFVAAANQSYFVRVDALFGVATMVRTDVQLVGEAEGRRVLEQSRFVGGTPPVVAAAAPRPAQPAVNPAPPPAPSVAPVPAPAPPPPPQQQRSATPEPDVYAALAPGRASEVALIVSTGAFTLSNGSQVVAGLQSSYDTTSKSVLGVQAEWRSKSGLALGGEIFSYKNDLATTGAGPDAQQATLAMMANAKYYFRATSWLQPFVGAGIGYASATYSGNITGTATGLAYQGMAGAEFRFNHVGLYLQYKYLAATTGDAEKVTVGGSGILAGLSVIF